MGIKSKGYNVDIAQYYLPSVQIPRGDISGWSSINKFGAAIDYDTGDLEVTMWDGSEDGTAWENMVYDYSATADIDTMSSNAAGTQNIEIQGLDTNGDLVVQTVALTGTGKATLGTSLKRIFRAKNVGTTDLAGHVFIYPDTAITNGIPDDASKNRAIIHPENNQTEMAIFTVPTGKTAYMTEFYVSTAAASRSAEYEVRIKAKSATGVFQLKHRLIFSDDVLPTLEHTFNPYPSFSAGTDIEMTVKILTSAITAASSIGGFDLILVDN